MAQSGLTIDKNQDVAQPEVSGLVQAAGGAHNLMAKSAESASDYTVPLLQRLSSFGDNMAAVGSKKQLANAEDQALIDMAAGVFKKTDGTNLVDQVYDSAGEQAFISSTTIDINNTMASLEAKYLYSEEGFSKAWTEYTRALTGKAPSETGNIIIGQTLRKYGGAGRTSIAKRLTATNYKLNKESGEKAIEIYKHDFVSGVGQSTEDDDLINLYKGGVIDLSDDDLTILTNIQEKYKIKHINKQALDSIKSYMSMSGSMEANYMAAPGFSQVKFEDTMREAIVAQYTSEIQSADGSFPLAIISENMERISESGLYTPDELKDVHENMIKVAESKFNAIEANEKAFGTAQKVITRAAYKSAYAELFDTGKISPQTQQELRTNVRNGLLEEKDYIAIMDLNRDDKGLLIDSAEGMKLMTTWKGLTPEQIWATDGLTFNTRAKYAEKASNYRDSDEGKWTNEFEFREGGRMLAGHFDILPNAMINLGDNEKIRAYTEMRSKYVGIIMMLDPEQRESHAIPLAKALIARSIVNDSVTTPSLAEDKKKRERKKTELKKAKESRRSKTITDDLELDIKKLDEAIRQGKLSTSGMTSAQKTKLIKDNKSKLNEIRVLYKSKTSEKSQEVYLEFVDLLRSRYGAVVNKNDINFVYKGGR